MQSEASMCFEGFVAQAANSRSICSVLPLSLAGPIVFPMSWLRKLLSCGASLLGLPNSSSHQKLVPMIMRLSSSISMFDQFMQVGCQEDKSRLFELADSVQQAQQKQPQPQRANRGARREPTTQEDGCALAASCGRLDHISTSALHPLVAYLVGVSPAIGRTILH